MEQRVEWVTRTMVACVHHHKLLVQLMTASKCLSSGCIESRHVGMRPGRDDLHSIRRNAFGNQPVSHKSIERDNSLSSCQGKVLQPVQGARDERTFAQPAGRQGFI